jgi:hypothetical protein
LNGGGRVRTRLKLRLDPLFVGWGPDRWSGMFGLMMGCVRRS